MVIFSEEKCPPLDAILLNDLSSDTFFSLREKASKQSVNGGQEYKKYNCKVKI